MLFQHLSTNFIGNIPDSKKNFSLQKKYIGRIKKKKTENNTIIKDEKHIEEVNAKDYPSSNEENNKAPNNLGSPLKF